VVAEVVGEGKGVVVHGVEAKQVVGKDQQVQILRIQMVMIKIRNQKDVVVEVVDVVEEVVKVP